MEWVETTGKSIDEAKGLALDQLGVDENDAEFEVMDEPKAGLFGFGKSEARIRARVRPTAPRSKELHSRRKKRPERDRGPKEAAETSSAKVDGDTVAETAPRRERPPRKPKTQARRPPRTDSDNEGDSAMDEHVALADQADTAKVFLQGLLDEIELEVDITVDLNETDEMIFIAVHGENLGHLIGPRGTALHSLQELTRTVVQRKTGARNGRIVIDIAQYREKRRVALERFTHQIADEVLTQKVTRMLEPMHPSDRKIVHDTINTIDGVITTSEGEEPRRRVVIKPAESA